MEPAQTPQPVAGPAPEAPAREPRLPWVICLLLLIATLTLSRWLTPDPRGYGTHEHLTHLPCTFRLLTHLPCPFCGMTTAFAYMSQGQVSDAFRSSPFGPLLWLLALLGIPYTLYRLAGGRSWLPPGAVDAVFAPRRFLIILAVIWAARLLAFRLWR